MLQILQMAVTINKTRDSDTKIGLIDVLFSNNTKSSSETVVLTDYPNNHNMHDA